MGAVNYTTSDYVTLGVIPYDSDDFENDVAIEELYSLDYKNIEYELKKYYFNYFYIDIKPGYYEGFTLDIEFNYGLCFDSWEDRTAANKEITEIKKFLKDCAGLGMAVCFPGWCTIFCDYAETLKEIDRAIKEMRKTIKETPTWNQYNAECI